MQPWLYALECVVAPCAIGVLMYAAFDAWDRWRRSRSEHYDGPSIDYHI